MKKKTKDKFKPKINIKNKKAWHDFTILSNTIAGIVLVGTEIKSIRDSKVSFTDCYCIFKDDELWLKNLHISPYTNGGYVNHEPKRDRKLLLKKNELKKLSEKIKMKGLTIVPLTLFINDRGLCKIEIALAQGKKTYEKRESIKIKDTQRENYQKIRM